MALSNLEKNNINAIILVAGMGTRLRPLTNDRPKCLVEVNGTPMVEHQIQYLKAKGINDITLLSGYKAEALDYLKDNMVLDIYHDMDIYVREIDGIYEIDTPEELNEVENQIQSE